MIDKNKIVGTEYHNVKITTSYNKLCLLLGKPYRHKNDKTIAEWLVEAEVFGKTCYFVIYDYKAGKFRLDDIIDWHIASVYDKNTDETFKKTLIKEINING